MPRRNKYKVIFLMPIATALWLIGWSLYWLGLKTKAFSPKETKIRKATDDSHITVVVPEKLRVEA